MRGGIGGNAMAYRRLEVMRGNGYLWLLLLIIALLQLYRIVLVGHLDLTLYLDEAYYWEWAQQLDWGYYSKPPLIGWLIAATTAIWGDSVLAVKAGTLLLHPITALLLFILGQRLVDSATGFYTALLYLTTPALFLSGIMISTDVLLLLFWSAALLLFTDAISHGRWRDWLLLGVVCGLGLLSKYTMGIFAISALLFLLLSRDHRYWLLRREPYLTALLALLLLLPNVWWNWQHHFPTLYHTAEISHLAADQPLQWLELLEFQLGQLLVFGPIFLPLFLYLVLTPSQGRYQPGRLLLLCFSLPFLIIISLQALLGRANANWAVPAFIAATLLVVAWLLRFNHHRWLWFGLLLNSAIGFGLYHYEAIANHLNIPLRHGNDPYLRLRGWPELAAQLIPHLDAEPAATLLVTGREPAAQLRYLLRDRPLQLRAWFPGGKPQHHYQLMQPLREREGGPFLLLISSEGESRPILARFESQQFIATLQVTIHSNYVRLYRLYRIDGFKGYHDSATATTTDSPSHHQLSTAPAP